MSKYDLTLSPDYLPHWGIVEAVRELFQNALDNQAVDPDNQMFFERTGETLRIGNKTSKLEPKTLLLGSSTKREDDRTIGVHGEGYKVAFLVLLRMGKKVTVYNHGRNEVWTTRLVKSRRFQGQTVVRVETKPYIWSKRPDNDLMIEIEGVTEEEYAKVVKSNLHLRESVEKIEFFGEEGFALTDPSERGNIYVNGLYVTFKSDFKYGYSLSARDLPLDRDRQAVYSFEVSRVTSRMWRYYSDEKILGELIMDGKPDVQFIQDQREEPNRGSSSEGRVMEEVNEEELRSFVEMEQKTSQRIIDVVDNLFVEKHGENAVPVSTNDTMALMKRHLKLVPVVINPIVSNLLAHRLPDNVAERKGKEVKQLLKEWGERNQSVLDETEYEEFTALVARILI